MTSLAPISWRTVRQHEERLDALDGGDTADWIPGKELGYAELTADFTSTNTSFTNTTDGPGAGGVIPGAFQVTVVGKGKPVEVEFYAPQVRHSTAGQWVGAYLLVNGAAQPDGQLAIGGSPVNTVGRVLVLKRRLVLADGVSYTFKVGIMGGAAGTSTVTATAATNTNLPRPFLAVTAR